MGNSPITSQPFYSSDYTSIVNVCKVLNIGEGKLATITKETVEFYQEMIDREIDGMLEQYYFTPLISFNQKQPDGTTKSVFPGNVRSLAIYWTAGRLLLSEFQQLEPNVQETSTNYQDVSRRELFDIIRYNRRIRGQRLKHNLKNMPPSLAPGINPEPNF